MLSRLLDRNLAHSICRVVSSMLYRWMPSIPYNQALDSAGLASRLRECVMVLKGLNGANSQPSG